MSIDRKIGTFFEDILLSKGNRRTCTQAVVYPLLGFIWNSVKVALGVCFALKSWREYLLLFTYLITLGKDVTLPLITKFKTNRSLSNLFVNRIPN